MAKHLKTHRRKYQGAFLVIGFSLIASSGLLGISELVARHVEVTAGLAGLILELYS